MSKSFSSVLVVVATVLATVFAGVQTLSTWSIFNEKKVQYKIKNVSVPEDMTGNLSDISISVKTQAGVKNLNSPLFFDLLIKNTGNENLSRSDFDGNISFTFKGNSSPLKVQQVEQSHNSLKAEISIEKNSINISPLMLNSGDYFVVRVLLEGKPTDVIPSLRVLGMTEEFSSIQDSSQVSSWKNISIYVYCIFCFLYIGRIAAIEFLSNVDYLEYDRYIIFFTIYLGGLLAYSKSGYLSGLNVFLELLLLFLPAIISFMYLYFRSKSED
ncbi:TPA: hypothetical protein ACX3DQ_004426 [Vibrio parahaemolyticus]